MSGQRNLGTIDKPLMVTMNYDLAKLWTIIKPMVPPGDQASVADLTMSGQHTQTFKAWGSYPAGLAFNQAVAKVGFAGVFTIDSLSTHGISITNFDLPMYLADGVFQTVYEGGKPPRPAACNDGVLDLGKIVADLRTADMLVS